MNIRQGSADDLKWIVKLLIKGTNDGHFTPTMKLQAKGFLKSVIENGGVRMRKLRDSIQPPVFVPMELFVAEIDEVPASYLICCKDNNEVEIHLAGTKESFKKKGCFTSLVNNVVLNNIDSKIYARCYKNSFLAIDVLKNLDFKVTKSGDPIELTLQKTKPNKSFKRTKKSWLGSLRSLF